MGGHLSKSTYRQSSKSARIILTIFSDNSDEAKAAIMPKIEALSEEVEALNVSILLPALSFFCFVTVVLLTVGVSKIVYKKSGRGK